jgi:hypothetical protein
MVGISQISVTEECDRWQHDSEARAIQIFIFPQLVIPDPLSEFRNDKAERQHFQAVISHISLKLEAVTNQHNYSLCLVAERSAMNEI